MDPPVTGLKIETPGSVDAGQYDQAVRDITNFLEYAGEPPRSSASSWACG